MNGGGKTTLVHMLIEKIQPDDGAVKIGHNVKMAIFYQEHKHLFQGTETLLEWLQDQIPNMSEEKTNLRGDAFSERRCPQKDRHVERGRDGKASLG